ncbi:MAG TPA: cytochrome P450 [Aggregatilineaceae bacterium]|nr:cytochrome P450 [Aggregatilineaceae bacterium]
MSDRFPPGPDHNVFQAARSTLRQQRDRLGFLVDMAKTYGEICHFHTGLRDIYLVTHPDYVREVLVEQADKFNRTTPAKRAMGKYLGQGLLVIDGDLHRRERRLAQPAFHHQRIEAYAEVMVRYTQQLVDQWQPGQARDVSLDMTRLTSGIVAKCLFDADVSDDAQEIARSMSILQEAALRQFLLFGSLRSRLPSAVTRHEREAVESLDRLIYRIIDQRRVSDEDRGDLLSMLLMATDDDGARNSIQQIHDEVITLFIAGHETTSNALVWAWYLLSQNREVAARLRQELADVLRGRAPTLDDFPRLAHCTMIIRETLRLYPSAWAISRQAIEDLDIGGYLLKAGSVLITSPYITHRLPRYFPDPECFRPERFAPGEQSLPRFAYFPFGGGPHICIGQSFAMLEAVLILATIAQRYTLELVHDHPIEMDPLITLRVKDGIRMIPQKTPDPHPM